jgi:hypothetical protein
LLEFHQHATAVVRGFRAVVSLAQRPSAGLLLTDAEFGVDGAGRGAAATAPAKFVAGAFITISEHVALAGSTCSAAEVSA